MRTADAESIVDSTRVQVYIVMSIVYISLPQVSFEPLLRYCRGWWHVAVNWMRLLVILVITFSKLLKSSKQPIVLHSSLWCTKNTYLAITVIA